MPAPFSTSVDIANRALQHCGASRITSFTDGSRNASEVAFVYDKVRVAELRRNVWRFAIRKAILRPVDITTMLLVPAAFNPANSYIFGSIVSYAGLVYFAAEPTSSVPGTDQTWEQYFGPLTMSQWNPPGTSFSPPYSPFGEPLYSTPVTAYFAGELVYTPSGVTGDTSVSVYMSLQNGNSDTPTVIPAWISTVTYNTGATVTYSDSTYQSIIDLNLDNTPGPATGWVPLAANTWTPLTIYGLNAYAYYNSILYQSGVTNNIGNVPPLSGGGAPSADWIFVVAASTWVNSTTYANSDAVMYDGTLYQSIASGNTGNEPDTSPTFWTVVLAIPTWSSSTTYASGDYVFWANAGIYQSAINGNLNNPPTASSWTQVTPALWDVATTYSTGTVVSFAEGLYSSTEDSNTGNVPTTGWEAVPADQVDQMQGQNWLKLDAGYKALTLVYPLGTGPLSQQNTRNVFRLPNGFLRKAPEDPKAGATSWLGSPMGQLFYDDWLFEGDYITSSTPTPLMIRFVADIADVTEMDPMFCEGLGARIGIEVVEILTQSEAKLAAIGAAYREFMAEARTVNGIETGAEMPPLDDWLACRI